MITAIIVDDEQKNVSTLVSLLQQYCGQVTLLGTANSAAGGKKLIENLKPHLVFLDIEMPYGSGFDLLESLPGIEAEVIFITAFNQYALNAFRYAALDYLLKPVNIEELEDAVRRAEKRIREKTSVRNYDVLLRNLDEKDTAKQTIAFADKGQQYLVPLADIMYIVADGSYTHVHTANKTIVSTKNLKDFENMLPATVFCRIHHGHLVNKTHIAKIQKGRGGVVSMKDGTALEIAVRRKEDFLKMFRK
jgi:two-component system, LytTR family, response regulator